MTYKLYQKIATYNGEPLNNDRYLINNEGEIFDCVSNSFKTVSIIPKGYKMVSLFGKGYLISRLVCEHFVDNPNNKPCVDHIDGNKLNNIHSNLRWVTYKENNNNPITKSRNRTLFKKGHRLWDNLNDEQKQRILEAGNRGRQTQIDKRKAAN